MTTILRKTSLIDLSDWKNRSLEDIRRMIDEPAKALASGRLVAFPTETVYGLGANAFLGQAVGSIFTAKGRPSDNPLIVHVSDPDMLNGLAKDVPLSVHKLVSCFWPGPLTMVLQKRECIPDEVTAGLNTVGIRMPAHPVAIELIKQAGVPVAAPSANTSGMPSPTLASHVYSDLQGKVDYIIDGGPAGVGLESTVLDMTSERPAILRPGGITEEQLREVLGDICTDPGVFREVSGKPRSPGMKYKHYAPKALTEACIGPIEPAAEWVKRKVREYHGRGMTVGLMCSEELAILVVAEPSFAPDFVRVWGSYSDSFAMGAKLFSTLREMDDLKAGAILVQGIPAAGFGAAVMNRLYRATGHKITNLGE